MDLTNYISDSDLLERKNIKKIFFYRICGTGMGAAACLLKEHGFDVSGCDLSFSPPMSTYLESVKIPCYKLEEVDSLFLQQFDLIIVGNSVPRDSKYATLIENCGVSFTSFPSVLGTLILKDCMVVGLAGTHGKTTTTYLITQLFEKLGQNPGYLVGGIMEGRAPSKLGGKNSKHSRPYFFIESDEYDSAYFQKFSKFRLYTLDHMILTSLEFDHGDIFDTVEDIEDEFRVVIDEIIEKNGSFIFSAEYPSIRKLAVEIEDKSKKIAFYGEGSNIGPKIIMSDRNGTEFSLVVNGKSVNFKTNLVGEHNILNLSSSILFAIGEGFSVEDVSKAVLSLKLVKRRQEVRGTYHGAVVIDDFAHHPRAVKMTIDSIRTSFSDKKIVVVMEPISATARSSIFQKEFAESLRGADRVIIAKPSIVTTIKRAHDLDCDLLVKDLSTSIPSSVASTLDQLRNEIDNNSDSKSLLLILSNRTCLGLWESDFVDNLKNV